MMANLRLIFIYSDQVNFYIFRKYMPEAISTLNWVALSIISQELGRAFLPPNQNRTYQIAQPLSC